MNQNSAHNGQSSVCLDGNEIKRLRETQRLTQLYVSKVVGVTTDTVSRWENNRYPSIRRENALKLAEALDVPLEAILRQSESEETVLSRPPQRRSTPYVLVGLVLVVAMTLLITLNVTTEPKPPLATVTAQRILPKHAAPGTAIPVMVELTQSNAGGGFILRENFPKGWKIVQSSPPTSSLDNVNGVARWIIKVGDERERIVYLVQVDPGARPESQGAFQGEIIVGSQPRQSAEPVLGDTRLSVAPVHWADSNGDGRIDDVEMLQASYTIEDMAGVHIDWDHLERLWDAGSYQWDQKRQDFRPVARDPAASPR